MLLTGPTPLAKQAGHMTCMSHAGKRLFWKLLSAVTQSCLPQCANLVGADLDAQVADYSCLAQWAQLACADLKATEVGKQKQSNIAKWLLFTLDSETA